MFVVCLQPVLCWLRLNANTPTRDVVLFKMYTYATPRHAGHMLSQRLSVIPLTAKSLQKSDVHVHTFRCPLPRPRISVSCIFRNFYLFHISNFLNTTARVISVGTVWQPYIFEICHLRQSCQWQAEIGIVPTFCKSPKGVWPAAPPNHWCAHYRTSAQSGCLRLNDELFST